MDLLIIIKLILISRNCISFNRLESTGTISWRQETNGFAYIITRDLFRLLKNRLKNKKIILSILVTSSQCANYRELQIWNLNEAGHNRDVIRDCTFSSRVFRNASINFVSLNWRNRHVDKWLFDTFSVHPVSLSLPFFPRATSFGSRSKKVHNILAHDRVISAMRTMDTIKHDRWFERPYGQADPEVLNWPTRRRCVVSQTASIDSN